MLLERRPEKGHLYPGMWNFPGGNLQTREFLFDGALRLVTGLGLTEEPHEFSSIVVLAGTATYVKTPAEVGVSHLFVGKILKRWPDPLPQNCQVFNLDHLPEDLVPWQAEVYPDMIRQFLFHGPSELMEYRGE